MDQAADTAHDAGTASEAQIDLVEAIRLQAEEHPLIDDKAPESLSEKCLHLMHLKAYDEAAKHTAGRDVLDVGCNTGYGTLRLVPGSRSVTGVDVSPAAVHAARSRPGAEVATFEVIDGLSLPFPDQSFDVVTSFQVVEHVADATPYLREIKRVLRPGGLALFTTPNAAIRLDPGMTPWNRFHVREYRATELADALGEVFAEVDVLGMFGVPTLYDLEIERVDANRRGVRRGLAARAAKEAALEARTAAAAAAKRNPAPPKPAPTFIARARRRLGRTAPGAWLRRTLGRVPTPVPVPAVAPAPASVTTVVPPDVDPKGTADVAAVDFSVYAVGDLFYSGRDLDRSMDLMALCRVAD